MNGVTFVKKWILGGGEGVFQRKNPVPQSCDSRLKLPVTDRQHSPMTTSASLPESPSPPRFLAGEVHGTVLRGFIEACAGLHILAASEQEGLAGDIEPDRWYPLERFAQFEQWVESKFEQAAVILEKAGIEFAKQWAARPGYGGTAGSGVDFLLLQCESKGYGQIVRGDERDIGRLELIRLDLIAGAAVIVSDTPFSRDFERGAIAGGMLAVGDLWYVKVDNSQDPDRFQIDFKPGYRGADLADPAAIPGIQEWDSRLAQAPAWVERLYWRHQALVEEQRRDRAFWRAAHAALERLAAELRQVSQQMKELAHRDTLTGLLNRRGILLALAQEFSRSVRYGQPLSLAILDVDWFKQVNDTHGHLVGDEVLRQTASLFSGMLRLSDTIGRLSGEEFLIIFPSTALSEAVHAADKLRMALGRFEFSGTDGPFTITASFGVAGRSGDIENPMEMLRRADCALYQAKAAGRDRVERFVSTDAYSLE
jgi:diguanylate cyclase (GGDEF)-like protein